MKHITSLIAFLLLSQTTWAQQPSFQNEKEQIEIHRPDLKRFLKTVKLKLPFEKISKRVEVEQVGDLAVIQGDIILGKMSDLEKNEDAASGTSNRWNCSIVPYVISHPDATNINTAIAYINTNTNVRFVPRTTETDYVDFVLIPSGFSSNVGRQGGRQTINLQANPAWGKVLHEMTHAIGFYHEHCRTDRDSHITVSPSSILSNINFIINGDSNETEPYDFESIMHYPASASVSGLAFIITPITTVPTGVVMGQRDHYSASDIAAINRIYRPAGTSVPDDYIMRDTPADLGLEPNTLSTSFYQSNDIWVRNNNDLIAVHQNPVASQNNTVYVRITNNGWCNTQDLTGTTLQVYWAKAGLGLSWPSPWNGSNPIMGGSLSPASGISVPAIPDGESIILALNWIPNPPSMYTAIPDADKAHFCLLARLSPGITHPETNNLHSNVSANNNLAWKNVQVEEVGGDFLSVLLTNPTKQEDKYFIRIKMSKEDFILGKTTIKLGDYLNKQIVSKKAKTSGLKRATKNQYFLRSNDVFISNIGLPKEIIEALSVKFDSNKNLKGREIPISVELYSKEERKIGGEVFVFKSKREN